MEITLDPHQPAPVLRLAGRFDGDGATAFDTFVEGLDGSHDIWILDFGDVRYLSSMGLRSLVKAEKRLRERHGMLVLAALSRPVRQVLEMARLHTVLHLVDSVDDALLLARSGSVAPNRAVRSTREGRTCAAWVLGGRSLLETWGAPPAASPGPFEGHHLATFTIEDLGCAFGLGGFGSTRDEACEATGLLFIAPRFAGLRPAGTSASDFVVPERPSEALVHVASALGLEGTPHVAVQIGGEHGFSITDVVHDVVASSAPDGIPRPTVTAVIALVNLADHERPAILLLMATDRAALANTENGFHALTGWLTTRGSGDLLVAGRAALLAASVPIPPMTAQPADILSKIATLDSLDEVADIDPAWRVTSALAWGYR